MHQQFDKTSSICLHTVKDQTVLFRAIQFRSHLFALSLNVSSIRPIDRTLSGITPLGQSRPRGNGNEGVLRILQSSSSIGASQLDCLVSYPGHS